MTTNALRPLTVGELLDRIFVLYRRHFSLFVGIAAIPGLLTLTWGVVTVLAVGSPRPSVERAFLALLTGIVSIVVYLIASALAQGATMVAVSRIQLGEETSIKDSLNAIRGRIGEISLVILNVGLRVFFGFLLLVIPGVILALAYSLAVPVAVLEERGVSASLSRSSDLTRGHRGRIFVIYLLLTVLLLIVGALWQVPSTLIMTALVGRRPSAGGLQLIQLAASLSQFVIQAVFTPIMQIGLAVMYYDERIRKEGFDLEHMMHQLDAIPPSGPSPTA